MSQAIPLTNSSQLAQRVGHEVRIIGKVLKVGMHLVSGEILLLEASDNGTVEIKLQPGETPTSQYVEVIGRVSSSGDAITQHALLSLGDNLDLSLVESLVKFTPQYPSLFAD
ncbi:single-stranded dna binding protein 12k chain [Malassezia pachydermatis]|uniref:Single-stranded dna binding protein 12k chain n=1 Tax=Malassezia pachydermatis TaxID=77020 RepID=A0A0M8MQE6_9BASI|nr:single-stranded dna binding protein 12k chain [Malassezia pachydermatis]KOS14747.1 single-stranded dna binding protein 12k chain [Malassezia pachydermatis]